MKEGLDPRRLDEALVRFGMIDGPLEYLDLMGLDVAAALAQALAPVLGTRIPLDGTPPWMVGQKWLGQKTGLGFYRYRGRRHKVNQALVSILRAESHAGAPYRMEALSVADQMKFARRRLVPLMVNEAAWCLEEGLVDSPESLDLALALAGWAPHRGGPIHYARHLGIDNVIRELAELADKHGPGYEACPGWRRKIV